MAKNTGKGSRAGAGMVKVTPSVWIHPDVNTGRFLKAKAVGGSFGKINPYRRPGWFARIFLGKR